MSIRVPSSRGPKEENVLISTAPKFENSHSSKLRLTKETNTDKTLNGNMNSLNSKSSSSTNRVNSRQSMEMAVSSLAKAQQAEIQRLMQQQEKERTAMKTLFEQQQRRLIQVNVKYVLKFSTLLLLKIAFETIPIRVNVITL